MTKPLASKDDGSREQARLKWEYAWREYPSSQFMGELDRDGRDGWEAWSHYQMPNQNWIVFLKRPLLQACEAGGSPTIQQ